jgi:hypothetical protein
MFLRCLILLCLLLSGSALPALAASERADQLPGGILIGTVTFSADSIRHDSRARRELDALIPALLKKGNGTMVRLEGHARPGKNREEYIRNSLNLAKEVERYFRIEQKVTLDLYLAAMDDKISPRNGRYVRVVAYPLEFKEQYGVTQVIGQ